MYVAQPSLLGNTAMCLALEVHAPPHANQSHTDRPLCRHSIKELSVSFRPSKELFSFLLRQGGRAINFSETASLPSPPTYNVLEAL